MASAPLSTVLLLAFLFLVAAAPDAGAFDEHVDGDDDDHHFLLLDCGISTAPAPKNITTNLANLLAALPSVAAPAGSAVLSNGTAFVRGVCIGNNTSTDDCRACLSSAAGNITTSCGGPTRRRGGAWSDGCFLAYYADSSSASWKNDSRKVVCHGDTPRSYMDDGDRGSPLFVDYYGYWTSPDPTFYWLAMDLAQRAAEGPAARMVAAGEMTSPYRYDTTVRGLAQCTGDAVAPAGCLRCLRGAAWQAVLSCGSDGAGAAGWLRGGRVLSYGCYLRFEVRYGCGDGVAGCSAAPAPARAFLRWLVGALLAVAVILLHGQGGM